MVKMQQNRVSYSHAKLKILANLGIIYFRLNVSI